MIKWVLLSLFFSASLAYSVWPQPQVLTRGSTPVSIDPSSFQFVTPSSSSLLKAAIERYKQICFPFNTSLQDSNLQGITEVTITVLSSDESLQLGVNESYCLSVTSSGADIQAETVFGAIRGLESLAQLIDYDYSSKSYSIQDLPIFISDSPRFPWRGLMIDTARHYLSVQTILTMIDAMAYNKMNTLHWHITDSQSFPLQSVTFPNLAKAGSYSFPEATYDAADVKTIVNYAYERGVRVVPEFDMPGHTYSWGLGYPDIIINCSSVLPAWGISAVTLDITNPDTYKLLNGFLAEVKSLFMDDHMHLGMDEVQFACWNNSHVLDWMQNNGIASFIALEQYFEDNLEKITTQNQINNRVFWEDAFISNDVKYDPATSMFTVWRGLDALTTIVQAGYKAVLANGFYLDVQQPGSNIHYEWVDTWQDFYTNEPFRGTALNLTAAEREFVLGGEACMWGEAVDDDNIFSRVWVRASGTAEKLWSSYNFTNDFNVDLAQARLMEFRCRLKQRGIHTTAIRPDYCPTPTSNT